MEADIASPPQKGIAPRIGAGAAASSDLTSAEVIQVVAGNKVRFWRDDSGLHLSTSNRNNAMQICRSTPVAVARECYSGNLEARVSVCLLSHVSSWCVSDPQTGPAAPEQLVRGLCEQYEREIDSLHSRLRIAERSLTSLAQELTSNQDLQYRLRTAEGTLEVLTRQIDSEPSPHSTVQPHFPVYAPHLGRASEHAHASKPLVQTGGGNAIKVRDHGANPTPAEVAALEDALMATTAKLQAQEKEMEAYASACPCLTC